MQWKKLKVGIGHAGRVRCEPAWRLDWNDPARLEDCDLWFVWAGRGQMTLTGGTRLDLRAGVCLWMRPGRTYEAVHDPGDPLGVTFIHFDLWRSTRRKVALAALPAEVYEVVDFAFFDAATRRVVELQRTPGVGDSRGYEAEALLMSVLAALARSVVGARGRQPSPAALENRRKIEQAVAAITESPGQVPAVPELARRWGYSAVHFSRVFRALLGESPQSFIVKTRVQRARQLLGESDLSVGEIAAMLGHPDVFFFSRQFKEKTGQSPSEFRRVHARGKTG